jgi:lipopolysaccharide biosynthesis glycosyltransferase
MFDLTMPTIKSYAGKMHADFLVADSISVFSLPHYEKLKIHDYLDRYDRIIYLDADVLVRKDCPNLFDVVPENRLGMCNESGNNAWHPDTADFRNHMEKRMRNAADFYGVDYHGLHYNKTCYWNTGVMVVSKGHKDIFIKPAREYALLCKDQDYLNLRILQTGIKMHDIGIRFNRMSFKTYPQDRTGSFIIHYASGENEKSIDIIKSDLQAWKSAGLL